MSQPHSPNVPQDITLQTLHELLLTLTKQNSDLSNEIEHLKARQEEQSEAIASMDDQGDTIELDRERVNDPTSWSVSLLKNALWRTHLVELIAKPARNALAGSKEARHAPGDRAALRIMVEELPEHLLEYGELKERNPRAKVPAVIRFTLRDLQAMTLRHTCSEGTADTFLKSLQAKKVCPEFQDAVKQALEFAREEKLMRAKAVDSGNGGGRGSDGASRTKKDHNGKRGKQKEEE